MSAALLPGDSLSDVMQQLHAQRSATSALEPLQSTACVLMIAPIHAAFNEDCAGDNHCHATAHGAAESADDAAACMREFSSCVTALRSHGVKVWVYVPDDNAVTICAALRYVYALNEKISLFVHGTVNNRRAKSCNIFRCRKMLKRWSLPFGLRKQMKQLNFWWPSLHKRKSAILPIIWIYF